MSKTYSIEMVRKIHTCQHPFFKDTEMVSHYTWEFMIVNEKGQIFETGFTRYRDAELALDRTRNELVQG
jgi:hypothetical protein